MEPVEYILYPHAEELYQAPKESVLRTVEDEWLSALPQNRMGLRLDFERLFGLGQVARQRELDGISDAGIRFLNRHGAADAWEILSAFLMGYWRGPVKVERRLVEPATLALAKGEQSDATRDQLICALASAWDGIEDPGLRQRVIAAFETVLGRTDKNDLQDMVVSSIDYVFGADR